MYTNPVYSSEVKLHRCIRIVTFKPAIKEASMDLLQLDYQHAFDVLMDDQLRQSVLFRPMSVTQADLLEVFLVKADLCAVEKLDEVLEAHPKDAIELIIDTELFRQELFELFRGVLPFKLPFTP